MIKKALPIIVGLLVVSQSAYADVSLKLKGIDGALADNVKAYLSSIPEKDYSTSLRFQARLDQSITEALNALGYYHAKISYSISEGNDELIVNIHKGLPVKIKVMDVVISGEAKEDEEFANLIAKSPLKVGRILNQGEYDSLKSGIRNLALQRGYFNGDFKLNKLEVIPELNEANVRLHYDSGIRYHFGPVEITGSQIWENRVESMRPFEIGEPYLVSDVGEYNQNLSNTDWFSSVFVEPDLSKLEDGRELPIKVSLAPAAKNQIETGIGYSTDTGVRGTLKWKKPWVSARGHSFNTALSLSKPEQTITAGYKIPLDDVLREYYQLQFGLKHLDNRDTESLESNLAVERHWLTDGGWHKTVYVRHLYENFSQGLQDDGVQFVLPGATFSRTRVRGGSMPMWGDKQSVTVEYGDPALLSETRVLRLLGRSSWIRGIGENHRGLFRLEGGANITEEFEKLSPSLRFFAGGDNNIRGYGYESISPVDESGALTGAKYILSSTLEYQYRVYGNWWAATFYDVGDAFNDTPEWKSGAGVGIRWASPVGPVSFDFAWGLDEKPNNEFRIHFSLGPEL
ncbi:autotransporter assembly complex family protein [Vibrio parahaemolyticus]|uniref:Translocation and assembly module subunit TamA n=1 Tax=Vibrio parahaemolyticus TaxID=670 RepID=A0AAW8Q4G8_VIBPH|nr:autotransporter assembly complex family protein [Vibrio parahaemolyticus]MCZ5868723.1 autotransporter assembly complex protein TamA [Vibrio parahaemolyticus]MCZ5899160.1 autotransporter assembly complex protein TamA [Vibrio parahaemolyticus]MCZ6022588.1 autotransporter assembly complex protein TamA [Vibrio parahaemolyticus]MCZ6248336.1 autotransporter assembly complex protein TamA [Vibrio parahaemolyticus]MCZ6307352.1 autotransporter assembly complex protein TamA [Vibrio parahaemolyticus]